MSNFVTRAFERIGIIAKPAGFKMRFRVVEARQAALAAMARRVSKLTVDQHVPSWLRIKSTSQSCHLTGFAFAGLDRRIERRIATPTRSSIRTSPQRRSSLVAILGQPDRRADSPPLDGLMPAFQPCAGLKKQPPLIGGWSLILTRDQGAQDVFWIDRLDHQHRHMWQDGGSARSVKTSEPPASGPTLLSDMKLRRTGSP